MILGLSICFLFIFSLITSRTNYVTVDKVFSTPKPEGKPFMLQGNFDGSGIYHNPVSGNIQFRIKSNSGKSLNVLYTGCCMPQDINDGSIVILRGQYTVEQCFKADKVWVLQKNIQHKP